MPTLKGAVNWEGARSGGLLVQKLRLGLRHRFFFNLKLFLKIITGLV